MLMCYDVVVKNKYQLFKTTSIEKVQAYWDRRPCNIRHSPKEPGTKEYYEEVEKRKYFVESHIPGFAEFKRWKCKKVLEIGCGIGTDTINFARSGAFVTAVDLSKQSLVIAQKRAEVFNLKNIHFYNADAENLTATVPIEHYDLIYSFGVIHHTPHPEKVIEQLLFYTHPETILKIMVYNRYSWKVFWILLKYGKGAFWKLNKLIAEYSEAQFGSPITYTYSKKTVEKLIPGFKITEIFVDHIFPYSISEYKNYIYKKIWYFRYMPPVIFRWIEKHLGWHLCVTAKKLHP